MKLSGWLGWVLAASTLASTLSPAHSEQQEQLEELRTLIETQATELEHLRARLDATGRISPGNTHIAKLRGRVVADSWSTSSRTSGVDYPSGTMLRSGRLGIEGWLGELFRYKFEADLSDNSVTTNDAYLQYIGQARWTMTIGNHKPPFSLENSTGLRRTTFMERALPNAFSLPRSLGLSVAMGGERWTLGFGLFGDPPDAEPDSNDGHAVASRASFAPMLRRERYVHLGLSGYCQRFTSSSGAGFRIRQRPETPVFDTRLVDTGIHPARTSGALAIELAGSNGRFAAQGEYMRNWVGYRAQSNATLDGAYLQASWFLTGEHRPYDAGTASLGRVRPRAALDAGGWGALELAARWSALDLNDGPVRGGSEENITLGLNWYPTAFTRFALNWVRFDSAGAAAVAPFGSPAHKGHAFGARVQVDW